MLHLRSILTGEHSELIYSLKLLSDTTFEKAKRPLLEAGGHTKLAAGIDLVRSDTRNFARMTPLQAFTHTEALVKRIILFYKQMPQPLGWELS